MSDSDRTKPAAGEREDHDEFEALLSDLFLRLMDLPGGQLDGVLREAQERLCRSLGLDRSGLWQTEDHGGDLLLTHVYDTEHYAETGPSFDGSVLRGTSREFLVAGESISKFNATSREFPWATRQVLAGKSLVLATLDELPEEAAPDGESFRRYGTRSTVIVPLKTQGVVTGCISFATTTRARSWPGALVKRFELIAQIFAKALARAKTERALQTAMADLNELKDRLQHENTYLRDEIRDRRSLSGIVGTSASIRRALDLAAQVAQTNSTVLLVGETGTGKERFAAAIHELSRRRSRSMVKVNCAAMPATLIESELFGREKGAYTGALTRQIGRFELANGSTLFLDEIGDLPIETQTKLLRAIETREFERLGSPHTRHVDVRIIAATNRDLEAEGRAGRFREDLYFRLNVFPITLPPLRERPEDIPLLVAALVDELGLSLGKRFDSISRASMAALQQYHWPGNIRELRNILERAMIMADGPVLRFDVMPHRRPDAARSLKAMEREHVLDVLQQTGWRIRGARGAAVILGLPPTTLENRMARLGIVRPGKRLPG